MLQKLRKKNTKAAEEIVAQLIEKSVHDSVDDKQTKQKVETRKGTLPKRSSNISVSKDVSFVLCTKTTQIDNYGF